MRELALQTEITSLDGTAFQFSETEKLTVGRGISRQLAMAKTDGEGQFVTLRLGMALSQAIRDGAETMLLETTDFEHLQRVVELNCNGDLGWVDIVQAQIRQALKDAPEVQVEKKPE